ncbi:MAG: ABC transporter ATP-binding protein [Planctomycetota bacterium]
MKTPLTISNRPAGIPGGQPSQTDVDLDPALVRVQGVEFGYRRASPVVKGVDLDLHAGRVHALLGDSGSGKTTLLRLIAGLEQLNAGRIDIGEQSVSADARHVPPEKRAVGIVFQDYALFPHLSVRQNVIFGLKKQPRRQRRADAEELLDRVGMQGFADAMPTTLSGGQQQRVALARALARKPQVMLLDEPFSGLDATLRDRVRDTTLRVMREAGVAILMVTHDPREALFAADTVSVMRNGRITATGRPHEICVRRWDYREEDGVQVCHECVDVCDG